MSEHTPGPWEYDQFENGEMSVFCAKLDSKYHGDWIAHLSHEGETDEANARLIAAAPELLAACKAALEDLYAIPSVDLSGGARVVRDYLRAAFAKAKGIE